MKTIIKGLTLSTFALLSAQSYAGSQCLGETYSGKLVKIDLVTVGTFGAFTSAEVTVTDADGKVLISDKTQYSAQFAETMRGKQAVVVYSNIGSNIDVQLNYLGKDYSELMWSQNLQLVDILKDPKRVKDTGNSLIITSYIEGVTGVELTDLVCSLDHDV